MKIVLKNKMEEFDMLKFLTVEGTISSQNMKIFWSGIIMVNERFL